MTTRAHYDLNPTPPHCGLCGTPASITGYTWHTAHDPQTGEPTRTPVETHHAPTCACGTPLTHEPPVREWDEKTKAILRMEMRRRGWWNPSLDDRPRDGRS